MRVGIISDIHGNLEALEAVLSRCEAEHTDSQTYSALRLLYETIMGRAWSIEHIPRSKQRKRLLVSSHFVHPCFVPSHHTSAHEAGKTTLA